MADRNMLYDPFGNPAPEMRSYEPAWHDRVVNRLTDLFYGPNANAQQRSGVNMLAGPENPLNIPAQVNQGWNTLGQGVALRDPAQAGIGVAQMAMSLPFGVAKGPAQAATKGIKAYHGSPHDFDRFSMDKIGTGEGAQAYGHGLYFAENEGVAKGYRDNLGKHSFKVGNEPFNEKSPTHYAAQVLAQKGSKEAALQALSPRKSMFSDRLVDDPLTSEARRIIESGADIPPYAVVPNGRMYEVNIKADPEHFLDWDKPLSQQSEKVRATIEPALRKAAADLGKGASAEKIAQFEAMGLKNVADRMRPKDIDPWSLDVTTLAKQYPNALRESGVPGVKYLDQGSRAAGEGSRNYVVFDDALVEILRKYGLAGLMAGGAAATATDPASAAQ